jgi:hypothetical protein
MDDNIINKTKTHKDDNDYTPFEDTNDDESQDNEPTGEARVKVLMSGKDMFVNFAKFLQIKYGIVEIKEMNAHPAVKLIMSNYIKCVLTERKLNAEGKIIDDVDEESKLQIKEFADYISYVGQTTVVTLSLEKVLGVAARLYTNFSYVNKAMSSTFKFQCMGKTSELTLKQLIDRLQEEYQAVGKTLMILEFPNGYNEEIANMFIKKRYAQVNKAVPANLVALKEFIKNKILMEESPYMNPRHIVMLANMFTDQSNTGYPEPTSDSDKIINANKRFPGRTVANIEDIMNLSYCKDEEEELLATQICTLLKVDIKREILDVFANIATKVEGSTLSDLEAKLGPFSVGWYSVSTSKTDQLSQEKLEYKRKLEAKFAAKPHIFFYLVSPTTYFFVEDAKGRKFSTAGVLMQYLHVLPRFYHYLQLIAQMHSGTVTQLRDFASLIVKEVVKKLSKNEKVQRNLSALLMVNVALWTRVTTYTKFAVVKDKHMPSRVITDDREDGEEDKVEEFGKDDVI